jgi:recombination endonuclease VII
VIPVQPIVAPNGLLQPTQATLNKYGGTPELWYSLAEAQGFVCGACLKLPKTCRLVIDHEHVRGWKAMATTARWAFVRGLLCWTCNHYRLARGASVENLRGAADYLERYEARRAAA